MRFAWNDSSFFVLLRMRIEYRARDRCGFFFLMYKPHPGFVVYWNWNSVKASLYWRTIAGESCELSALASNPVVLLCVAMAEASGSREERSEEGHDEAIPSLSGPVSPITAISPPHTNKMLRYFRDYLQRLPEHQRRRIQEEIEKGYKPGDMDCYVDSNEYFASETWKSVNI